MFLLNQIRGSLLLALCSFGMSCATTHIHTSHTPLVPVALEPKSLLASGSIDFSGASAEAQYSFKNNLLLHGALQGGSMTYNENSVFGGIQVFRTDWNSRLGTSYLLGKNRGYYFPLQVGVQGGGTKQSPYNSFDVGSFHGRQFGGYYQLGMLVHANWFQCYVGFQSNYISYRRPQTNLLKSQNLILQYNQWVGQMSFTIDKYLLFKTYAYFSQAAANDRIIDRVGAIHPIINIGLGFGINLNRPPKEED